MMTESLLTLPSAVLLTLASPAMAAGVAFYAFKRKAWRSYRISARASCFSSAFCLAVIGYVLFLGRGATLEVRASRVALGMAYGGVPVLALVVALAASVIGAILTVRRTDDERAAAPQVGQPMLAVFAILLLAFLAVALVGVQLQAGE